MGLFGYSKRTYKKNSRLIRDAIANAERMLVSADLDAVHKILHAAYDAVIGEWKKQYSSKQLAAIDARIFEFISKVEEDIRKEEIGMLFGHANMLFAAIECSRERSGKESYSVYEIKVQEHIAEVNGDIEHCLTARARLDEKMAILRERCKRIAASDLSSEELEPLQNEYSMLSGEHKRFDLLLSDIVENYNSLVASLEKNVYGSAHEKLEFRYDDTVSDFMRILVRTSENLQKRLRAIRDVPGPDYYPLCDSEKSDSFYAAISTASKDDGNIDDNTRKTIDWFD